MNRTRRGRPSVYSTLSRVGKFGAIAFTLIMASAACIHSNNPQAGDDGSAPTLSADTLLVSLDQARRITGVDNLASNPNGADDQPRSPKKEPPGPCRIFDAQIAYGNNWSQFRSAVYNGFAYPSIPGMPGNEPTGPDTPGAAVTPPPEPLMVLQSVGIYPDDSTARTAFGRLAPELSKCAALHAKYYDFTVTQPDPWTILLKYRINSETIYRVESSALINISTGGFSENGRVTDTILKEILDRIEK